MPTPHLHRADHVGFAVSSLDTALRFWVDALGGTLRRSFTLNGPFLGAVTGAQGATAAVAIVDVAGQIIELLEYADAPQRRGPAAAPFDPGTLHLAFTVDDLDAILARIAPHGWHPQGDPQTMAEGARAGTRVTYVTGPDGAVLELMQPPDATGSGARPGIDRPVDAVS